MHFKRVLPWAAGVVTAAALLLMAWIFSTPCLILRNGDTGKVLFSHPVRDGDEFSVTFIHSVNKSPVTDVYQIRDNRIYVVRTIYYSFGAGVQTEIEQGQTLEYGTDGSMIISGFNRRIDNLSYIVGTVSDHILEIGGQTISLRKVCGRNATVRFSCERRFLGRDPKV
jgi:hypothetical protein